MIFPRDDKAHPYIYKIVNGVNGKMYVGQTRYPRRRKSGHSHFKSGCRVIRNAMNKYGKDVFNFEIIEQCGNQELANHREVYWIKTLDTISPKGYNIMVGGKGCKHSLETVLKMIGRKHSPETIQKLKDRPPLSPEQCQKISLSKIGKHHSPETLQKLKIAASGKTDSLETRRKKSMGNTLMRFYPKAGCTSKFRGVYRPKRLDKVKWKIKRRRKEWQSYIKYLGHRKYLGWFYNEMEAAKAYDTKAKELFGEYARLNFTP